ncbi:MAG: hypothetical protein P4L86_12650 [Mycobacterium sp.]|nr:hypothetical protein [Mycobacterium sp.]
MRIRDDAKVRAVGLACAVLLMPVVAAAPAWADGGTSATDTKSSDAASGTSTTTEVASPIPVPHLSSPDNLPPYTTSTPDGSQDPDQLSYLRDVWHAVQDHEVTPKQALVLLAQRPMDAGAQPPGGMSAGPQAPPPGPSAPEPAAPAPLPVPDVPPAPAG